MNKKILTKEYNPFILPNEKDAVDNYDNEGAIAALQSLVDRMRQFEVTFYNEKNTGRPVLYIKQVGFGALMDGFKVYPPHMEFISNLWLYGFSGKPQDVNHTDTEETHKLPNDGNFAMCILKLVLSVASNKIVVVPKFLMRNKDKFRATLTMKNATFVFCVDRTKELTDLIEDYGLA